MIPRFWKEWRFLRRLRREPRLEEPRVTKDKMPMPLITLEVFFSLGPNVKIELWNSVADGADYRLTTQPELIVDTRFEEERFVAAADAEKILGLVERTSIVAMPPEGAMGIDGTTYKLTLTTSRTYQTALSIRWWHRAPEPWESLQLVVETLLRLVDKEVIAIEEAFRREGRTAPQVMISLFANLKSVEELLADLESGRSGAMASYFGRLSEMFDAGSPSICKQLARESRLCFNPVYAWDMSHIEALNPDYKWLAQYRKARGKLIHSFIEVQLVDFD